MRISDWSSDVCSSDLEGCHLDARLPARPLLGQHELPAGEVAARLGQQHGRLQGKHLVAVEILVQAVVVAGIVAQQQRRRPLLSGAMATPKRSEEHTSELQSLMRTSYAVFCLKKKTNF